MTEPIKDVPALSQTGAQPYDSSLPASFSVNPVPDTGVIRTALAGVLATFVGLGALGATLASTGRVRLPSATEAIVAFRDAGDTADVSALSKAVNASITLGDATNGRNVLVTCGPTGDLTLTSPNGQAFVSATDVTMSASAGNVVVSADGGTIAIETENDDSIVISTDAAGSGGTSTITLLADATSSGTGNVVIGANGTVTITSTNTINIGANNNAQTVNVGTGTAAITTNIGSTNSTSLTRVNFGTGGCGIGVAPPAGFGGLAIDAIQANNVDIGQTNANRVRIAAAAAALGFFGSNGGVKQTVNGAKLGNAALTSLIAALVTYGMITDGTT